MELFSEDMSGHFGAIVSIVYDDLATCFEKVADEFLTAIGDSLAKCDRFGCLFA